VISSFHNKAAESCAVLVYDTASSGKFFTTTHHEINQKERSSHIPLYLIFMLHNEGKYQNANQILNCLHLVM